MRFQPEVWAGKSIEPPKPSTFLLQFAALSKWAMLDLNQRPLLVRET
jgi:hypothetical protein